MWTKSVAAAAVSFSLISLAGCSSGKVTAPAALPAYDPSTATARVFGSIKFEGAPPVMEPIRAGGSAYCVRNGRGIVDEGVSITSDKKLRNVIVYVRSGQEGRSYETPAMPVVLDQQKCVYVPHVLTLMVNQKLMVRNSDPTFHNVHGLSQANPPFNFAQTEKGAENALSFDHPEPPFHIGCDLHRWMGAFVGVFDHPFHTISGTNGNFELRLPPGKYEIGAWQEKYGEKTATIDVTDKSQLELNFSFAEKTAN